MRYAASVIFVVSLILGGGCATPQTFKFEQPGRTDLIVKSIKITGNSVFSSSYIKSKIVTYVDPGWRTEVSKFPIFGAQHSYFNPLTWEKDKQRILTMYRANGYFNVRISEDRVEKNLEEKFVRLFIRIDEGEPTKIRAVRVGGIAEVDPPIPNLYSDLNLNVDDTFQQSNYLSAKDKLGIMLRNLSYAYATVRGKVYVYPELDVADIFFFVDLGPKCNFGEVTIEGLEDIDKEYVEEAVSFKPGEPYSPIDMQTTQANIYDLGVFSVVKVALESELENEKDAEGIITSSGLKIEDENTDEPSDVAAMTTQSDIEKIDEKAMRKVSGKTSEANSAAIEKVLDNAQKYAKKRTALSTVVPIVIRVREAKELNIRMGAGVNIEPSGAEVKLRLDWTDRNFFGGLRRIEQFNEFGYKWADNETKILPNFVDPSNQGWTARAELRFSQPQFIERFTSLNVNLAFRRDIQPNWTLMSPSIQIGLRRTWFKHLRTDISYNASLNFLSDLNIESAATRPPKDYILEYFEQRFTLDYLDNVINPTSGLIADLTVQEATNIFGRIPHVPGGDFDFILAQIGVRGYIPYTLGIQQVLGLKAKLGSIYTLGRGQLAPLPQRLYGGGINSIRSFAQRQFSIYSADSYGAYPLGGFTEAEFGVEPRFLIVRDLLGVGDFWAAVYVDAATILPGQLLIQSEANKQSCNQPDGCVESFESIFKSLIYGVGGGVIWNTPIGPFRVDFAYTVSDFYNDNRFRECKEEKDARGYCRSGDYYGSKDDLIRKSLSSWNVYFGIGQTF